MFGLVCPVDAMSQEGGRTFAVDVSRRGVAVLEAGNGGLACVLLHVSRTPGQATVVLSSPYLPRWTTPVFPVGPPGKQNGHVDVVVAALDALIQAAQATHPSPRLTVFVCHTPTSRCLTDALPRWRRRRFATSVPAVRGRLERLASAMEADRLHVRTLCDPVSFLKQTTGSPGTGRPPWRPSIGSAKE